jgi:NADPH-dependent 2,4-dienoyl-CoA reductase/sulfur reductase-like enzyme
VTVSPVDRPALLVIGGGPAALAAARGYRAAAGEGPVALVTDEGLAPYQRPPLTKGLLRHESARADLPLERDAWFADHDVRLVTGRAVALDAQARTVTLSGGRTLHYEHCVLAPGSEPTRLPVPGADDPGVRTLRSLADFVELDRRVTEDVRAIVVGSGFVGCEIAASLRLRGLAVTLVSDEHAPQHERLGPEIGARLADWLRGEGVDLRLGAPVARIVRHGERLTVETESGHAPTGELVVMAAGVRPRLELALAAGLECPDGAIPTDERLRTALPDVWAAGDVAHAHHAVAGRRLRVEHWGDALAQGEVAGRSAAGDDGAVWEDPPGFWSTIGRRTLKHAAWGDGWSSVAVTPHAGGAFTARYRDADGRLVGVLTHERDEDYELERSQLAGRTPVEAA